MQLSREALLNAYRAMKTIREFEERLHVEIQTGEIAGFTTSIAGRKPWRWGCASISARGTASFPPIAAMATAWPRAVMWKG
jgi:TPP-dependent pyruvate/acetoin dehydrogenase alpha subunit